MKYDVHLFKTIRVKVPDIEADSPQEAAFRADKMFDSDRIVMKIITGAECHFIGPAISDHYLVDEVGDAQYERSVDLDHEYKEVKS